MDGKKIIRFLLVYILLIPIMWIIYSAVWGGVHGVLGGITISKSLQDPQKSNEIIEFTQKHGLSLSASKKESKAWVENLSPKDKAEFQKLAMQSVKIDDIITFGSVFMVSLISFSIIGLISGIATKTWLLVGIFPAISFLLNFPSSRFHSIANITLEQKIIIVLVGQFLACYFFAILGALLAIRVAQKRQNKIEVKP